MQLRAFLHEGVQESVLSGFSSSVDRDEGQILIEWERVVSFVHTDLLHQPWNLNKQRGHIYTYGTYIIYSYGTYVVCWYWYDFVSNIYRLCTSSPEAETPENMLNLHQVQNSILINIEHLQRWRLSLATTSLGPWTNPSNHQTHPPGFPTHPGLLYRCTRWSPSCSSWSSSHEGPRSPGGPGESSDYQPDTPG